MAFWNKKINEKELEKEFLDVLKRTNEAWAIYSKINSNLQPIEYRKTNAIYNKLNKQLHTLEEKINKYCKRTYG